MPVVSTFYSPQMTPSSLPQLSSNVLPLCGLNPTMSTSSFCDVDSSSQKPASHANYSVDSATASRNVLFHNPSPTNDAAYTDPFGSDETTNSYHILPRGCTASPLRLGHKEHVIDEKCVDGQDADKNSQSEHQVFHISRQPPHSFSPATTVRMDAMSDEEEAQQLATASPSRLDRQADAAVSMAPERCDGATHALVVHHLDHFEHAWENAGSLNGKAGCNLSQIYANHSHMYTAESLVASSSLATSPLVAITNSTSTVPSAEMTNPLYQIPELCRASALQPSSYPIPRASIAYSNDSLAETVHGPPLSIGSYPASMHGHSSNQNSSPVTLATGGLVPAGLSVTANSPNSEGFRADAEQRKAKIDVDSDTKSASTQPRSLPSSITASDPVADAKFGNPSNTSASTMAASPSRTCLIRSDFHISSHNNNNNNNNSIDNHQRKQQPSPQYFHPAVQVTSPDFVTLPTSGVSSQTHPQYPFLLSFPHTTYAPTTGLSETPAPPDRSSGSQIVEKAAYTSSSLPLLASSTCSFQVQTSPPPNPSQQHALGQLPHSLTEPVRPYATELMQEEGVGYTFGHQGGVFSPVSLEPHEHILPNLSGQSQPHHSPHHHQLQRQQHLHQQQQQQQQQHFLHRQLRLQHLQQQPYSNYRDSISANSFLGADSISGSVFMASTQSSDGEFCIKH